MESESLNRLGLLRSLDELDAAAGEWVSVYLRLESTRRQSGQPLLPFRPDERLAAVAALLEDEVVQREVKRYGTGLVAFQSAAAGWAVVPPFPVLVDSARSGRPETAPLRELVERPRRIAYVLVTWGAYVAALYQGTEYLRHKKGTGHIHPPHRQGGSSQARFARRTEGQRAEFLRRAAGHIDDEFGAEAIEHLFFGGNRLILRPLAEECRFVRRNEPVLSPRLLLIKEATLASLSGAVGQAYSSVRFRKGADRLPAGC